MKAVIVILTSIAILLLIACSSSKTSVNTASLSKSEKIIYSSYLAHGGEKYEDAHYSFIFRGNEYQFKNKDEEFSYSSKKEKDGSITRDNMTNETVTRIQDGNKIELSTKKAGAIAYSLNSVIYFATLPHKLLDPAVNSQYQGETTILDHVYHVVEVHFDQEGGGKDYEDSYYYWINKKTNLIDYLAYNYKVNGGGARFRKAYNTRTVGGIIFQDYTNYKADYDTPLADLPKLYEQDKLKVLSEIKTEKVKKL